MTREFVAKGAIVLILILLGAVTLRFFFGDPFMPGSSPRFVSFAIALALGILLIGGTVAVTVFALGYVMIYLKRRNSGKTHGFETNQTEAFKTRLNEVDQRLTDVQDILITIDEKLSRLQENKSTG